MTDAELFTVRNDLHERGHLAWVTRKGGIEVKLIECTALVHSASMIQVRMVYAGDETRLMTRIFNSERAFRTWAKREASR